MVLWCAIAVHRHVIQVLLSYGELAGSILSKVARIPYRVSASILLLGTGDTFLCSRRAAIRRAFL